MWDTLGIPPTTDLREVRRAYAARLRCLDVDREPAVFMRLRDAFERATAACGASEPVPPRSASAAGAGRRLSWEEVVDQPAASRATPEAVAEALEPDPAEWLDSALADGRVMDAWRGYNRFLALGTIGLKDHRSLGVKVASSALHDASLSIPALLEIAGSLGPAHDAGPRDEAGAVRRQLDARVAALRWLDAVRETAGKPPRRYVPYFFRTLFFFWEQALPPEFRQQRHAVKAARLFMHRSERVRTKPPEIEAVGSLLEEYRLHARWLSAAVDEEWLRVLEGRWRRAAAVRERNDRIFLWAIGIFFLLQVMGILWRRYF